MKKQFSPRNVVIKALILYALFQIFLIFSSFDPAVLNIYRSELLQRERFPFVTAPGAEDRALDVGILDVMFASHVVSRPKQENEYRVIILGDSSIWGDPLPVSSTLAGQINRLNLTCKDKRITAYNLGYPLPSAIKDMMVLDKAMQYQPDLVIWGVTLYTLTSRMVEEHPLLETEPARLRILNSQYDFVKQKDVPDSIYEEWLAVNFKLFRTLRYQSYGLIQMATGADQIQQENQFTDLDLSSEVQYVDMSPPTLFKQEVNMELVNVFLEIAKDKPVLLVNEPILIVKDRPNSDLRYNSFYPRWAYDQYREYMNEAAEQYEWTYLDFWDSFASDSFANSPLHLNGEGQKKFADLLTPALQEACLK
jgi:hypothetical protein